MILPPCGLILLSFLTYESVGQRRTFLSGGGRYFWWGSIRLDSDPLGTHSKPADTTPCKEAQDNCLVVDPKFLLAEPGWAEKILVLSAVPAFLVSGGIVYGLSRLGVSEVVSFMASMPLPICAWFYFVGWLIDRRKAKRSG